MASFRRPGGCDGGMRHRTRSGRMSRCPQPLGPPHNGGGIPPSGASQPPGQTADRASVRPCSREGTGAQRLLRRAALHCAQPALMRAARYPLCHAPPRRPRESAARPETGRARVGLGPRSRSVIPGPDHNVANTAAKPRACRVHRVSRSRPLTFSVRSRIRQSEPPGMADAAGRTARGSHWRVPGAPDVRPPSRPVSRAGGHCAVGSGHGPARDHRADRFRYSGRSPWGKIRGLSEEVCAGPRTGRQLLGPRARPQGHSPIEGGDLRRTRALRADATAGEGPECSASALRRFT